MPPAISTKPNALLTRDVASFFVVNCDMAKFYDKVLSIAQEISGQPVEETINASLKSMAGEGNEPINLRKDLMEQLAGPVTVLVQASKPYDGPNAEQFLFSIALRDGVTVDKTVGKLFSAALGSMPTEMKKNMIREMNGVNIYAIPMPGLMGGDPATAMTNPTAIAVVGQNLFIGQLESVQRCIRDSSKPADAADSITADPLYEQAAKLLPAQASAFIYGNQQISAEIQWTVLKKMALEEAKKAQEGGNGASARHRPASSINPMAQLLDMVKEYVDFTALPDFATVKKYFGAEVGYVTSSEDGIYGEFHHIKAPPAFGP
jgi:hypothetical protein